MDSSVNYLSEIRKVKTAVNLQNDYSLTDLIEMLLFGD